VPVLGEPKPEPDYAFYPTWGNWDKGFAFPLDERPFEAQREPPKPPSAAARKNGSNEGERDTRTPWKHAKHSGFKQIAPVIHQAYDLPMRCVRRAADHTSPRKGGWCSSASVEQTRAQ
jgi:hypothetical protein